MLLHIGKMKGMYCKGNQTALVMHELQNVQLYLQVTYPKHEQF